LPADARVLDVGCGRHDHRGPGRPGSGRRGNRIDAAADVLALARAEADRRGQANVRFDVGDVYELGFATRVSTWCTRTRCSSTCPTR